MQVFHVVESSLCLDSFKRQNYQFLPLSAPRDSRLLAVKLLNWDSLQFLFLVAESYLQEWQADSDAGQRLLFVVANTEAKLPMEESYRLVQCLSGESLAGKSDLLVFAAD